MPIAALPGAGLEEAVNDLVQRCDLIYLHIDADILDEAFVPDHGTRESNDSDIDQVLAAVAAVMRTAKAQAYAGVSIYAGGSSRARDVATGIVLIKGGLQTRE